jgi:hypothetical protein
VFGRGTRRIAAVATIGTVAAVLTATGPATAGDLSDRSATAQAVQAAPRATMLCGPILYRPEGRARFCGQTIERIGRTGMYWVATNRHSWGAWRRYASKCSIGETGNVVVTATDGIRGRFEGYPQFRMSNGAVYTPGTQTWRSGGHNLARTGFLDHRTNKFHAGERKRLRPPTSGLYPASGRPVPCRVAGS